MLGERRSNNLELVERVLDKFAQKADDTFAQLEKQLAEENAAGLAKVAHGLKGEVANVAAEDVRRLAATLEELGRACQLPEAAVVVDKLRAEYDRCRQFVASRRNHGPTSDAETT